MTGVLIVGMHRSGTSMVTNMCHLLGVYVGELEDLLPAHPVDQPNGYWEHAEGVAINTEIMNRMGSRSVYEAFPYQENWYRSRALDDLRPRAAKLLHRLAHRPVFGLKDPRLSLTLSFWAHEIMEMQQPVKVIWAWRHPTEVMKSLSRRGLGLNEALYRQIADHHERIVRQSLGFPLHIVNYEDCLQAPYTSAACLATFLRDSRQSIHGVQIAAAAKVPQKGQKRSFITEEPYGSS